MGKLTGNPWSAVFISYTLHHLLDAVPHYNPKNVKGHLENGIKKLDKKDVALKSIEPAIGILVTLYLIFSNMTDIRVPMILGSIFGWLPDLFVFLNWKFKNKITRIIVKIEKRFHKHTTFWPGILPQIAIVVIAILILLR